MQKITGEQSKQAREFLDISQNKTAKGANVNRGYLSLFENRGLELPEPYMQQLINFYHSYGYDFDVIADEYIEEFADDGDNGYIFENNQDTASADDENSVTTDDEINNSSSEVVSNDKPNTKALGIAALLGTVAFLVSVANRNGVDVVDLIKNKFSKNNNNYHDPYQGF